MTTTDNIRAFVNIHCEGKEKAYKDDMMRELEDLIRVAIDESKTKPSGKTKEEMLTDYCKEHNIPRPDYSIVKMVMNVAESYAAQAIAEHDLRVLQIPNFIEWNGYTYWYVHMLARNRKDVCLATTDPKKYCNGYYLYSDKDPGTGKEFIIIKTNDPACELPTPYKEDKKEGGEG